MAALGARWHADRRPTVPVVAGIGLAFLVSLGLLFSAEPRRDDDRRMRWLTISNLEVPIEFRVDGLTTMMLSMVTFVSIAGGRLRGRATWPATRAIPGSSP